MASVRKLKRDIDYLLDEVVTDSYLSLYFHPGAKAQIVKVMEGAVELRNALYDRANSPVEPKNRSLVRKHYAALRGDLFTGIDRLFSQLSEVNKA